MDSEFDTFFKVFLKQEPYPLNYVFLNQYYICTLNIS